MWAIERAIALGATDAEEAMEIAGELAAYVEEGIEEDAPAKIAEWVRKAPDDEDDEPEVDLMGRRRKSEH